MLTLRYGAPSVRQETSDPPSFCAVRSTRTIGPTLFPARINSEAYVVQILALFFENVCVEEGACGFSQQRGATNHIVCSSVAALQNICGDEIISSSLWLPLFAHSPDLTPCDYYMWGSLKDSACTSNPHT